MFSLFIRNVIFTILQPGIVAGLLPILLLGKESYGQFVSRLFNPGIHSAGLIIFLLGFIIMVLCIKSFAVQGRGTLSPIDPTKNLVTDGLYKHSRNPMYVGVLLMLIGESIYFESPHLLIYTIIVFAGFQLFILYIEEPRLQKDFGEEYTAYCENVRRWI